MPALNFKAQFADDVCLGRKRQTIRAMRKRPVKPGDTLRLWTNQRQPTRRLLAQVQCKAVATIRMDTEGMQFEDVVFSWSDHLVEYVAWMDGFESAEAMRLFFEPRFPFHGQLIYW